MIQYLVALRQVENSDRDDASFTISVHHGNLDISTDNNFIWINSVNGELLAFVPISKFAYIKKV
jgi:hypothetical protein